MVFNTNDLNILYQASLEFGPNWRKSLIQWAEELFKEKSKSYQSEIAHYIEQVRHDIESLVASKYEEIDQNQVSDRDVFENIHKLYPWMNEDNVNHGFSQGMYYAWRG